MYSAVQCCTLHGCRRMNGEGRGWATVLYCTYLYYNVRRRGPTSDYCPASRGVCSEEGVQWRIQRTQFTVKCTVNNAHSLVQCIDRVGPTSDYCTASRGVCSEEGVQCSVQCTLFTVHSGDTVHCCPCFTVFHCTILYYTVLNCTSPYYTVLPCNYTVLYYTILYFTVLYCTILYYTVLHCTILYSTVLDCTILYYTTVLHCTILYYTVVNCTSLRNSKMDEGRGGLRMGLLPNHYTSHCFCIHWLNKNTAHIKYGTQHLEADNIKVTKLLSTTPQNR